MARGGCRQPRHMRPTICGGVTRHSRFSEFLSCDAGIAGRGVRNTFDLEAFVWPSAASSSTTGILKAASPQMLASIASAAAALGGAAGGGLQGLPSEVTVACIPFLAPGWGREDDARGDARDSDGLSDRARNLQRGLAATCFAQASCATIQFALNDGISGLIGCAIATLGIQASSPSGYRFLPSYIVLAFCNGTMQVLIGTEIATHAAALSHSATVGAKLASCVALASPALMFVGLALAWHLHCELRALALQALPQSMRNGLAMPPPVDGVVGAPAEGAIGQGSAVSPSAPFRPFVGQSHRLMEVK